MLAKENIQVKQIIKSIKCTHPEYTENVDLWCKIEDFIKGGDYAKKWIKNIEPIYPVGHVYYDEGRNYLAMRSCKLYREGAIYINFTLQTIRTIVGLALNSPPDKFELPDALSYLEKEATGNRLTFDQLLQQIIFALVSVGRIAVFTDFPRVDPMLDKEMQSKLQLVPRMYVFDAKAIDNWKTREVNGKEQLSMVKLRKSVLMESGELFEHKYQLIYLVLELDENGEYCQYEVNEKGEIVKDRYYPLKAGKRWNKIPITIGGSKNNDPCVDNSPIETIVELSMGHLRNSAIYEDNLKKHGRGTLNITSSLNSEEWKKFYGKRPLVLGTEEGYYFGTSGGMEIVQLEPAQAAAEAMEQKQMQLIMSGAHIVQPNPSNVATDTIKLNMGDKVSQLETIIGNAEDLLNEQIGNCAEFMKLPVSNDPYVKLSRQFIDKIADPLVMNALLAQFNGGAIPARILVEYNKAVGLVNADEKVEKIVEEARNQDPLNQQQPTNDNLNPTNNTGKSNG